MSGGIAEALWLNKRWFKGGKPLRTYRVKLKDNSQILEIQADDVDLDVAGPDDNPALFWNFLAGKQDSVTVAAIPLLQVEYITSTP
jgi:hypothetical protein